MAWLKAGILDEVKDLSTEVNEFGTPQGGIISPLLCNIALNGIRNAGLEAVNSFAEKKNFKKRDMISAYSLIRYADDFVAMHPNLDIILAVKDYISEYLKQLNLELNPDKTKIVHTRDSYEGKDPGFVFLSSHYYHMKTKKHGQYKSTGPKKTEKQIILVNKGSNRKDKVPVNLLNS